MRLSAQGIGNALYALKNLSRSVGTEAVLLAIAFKIRTCPQLDAQGVGNALYGLQNLTDSDGTEAVLLAIEPHIGKCPSLSTQELGNALYGLCRLQGSPGALRILQSLTHKIKHLSTEVSANNMPIRFDVADVLDSVNAYVKLGNVDERKIAEQFVREFIHHFQTRLPDLELPGNLSELSTLDDIIFAVIAPEAITRLQCDFHRCTYHLAKTLGTVAMKKFMDDTTNNRFQFVFGSSSHILRNEGRMRKITEDLMKKALMDFPGIKLNWDATFVTVSKASGVVKASS